MKTNELILDATVDNLPQVMSFLEQMLEETDCPMKAQMQLAIAAEEIFVNIAHYAYQKGTGEAEIRLNVTSDTVEITLIDSGIPYNPLEKPDPDVTLSAKDRAIGGLGIFMSKKLMDHISYEHTDGKNILTIKKHLK